MKVVIAGELPLADEVLGLCLAAGHEASLYLVETLADSGGGANLEQDAAAADVAVECYNESKPAKRRLVERLGEAGALLVSALACSATEAASWAARPARVVGWGAVTPLAAGGMMEVAPALQSAPETVAAADAFWQGLGLTPARVADGPGLVRARIICALVNEAATALAEGVASPADIDTAMKLGTNYPFGPLAWGDRIGLDVVLGVMRGLQDEFGEDRYRPCTLLTRYVLAGRLGQKAGRGFFNYPADGGEGAN
jgi:3-hydroxybutyryl-CoA dehydrogenase